MGEVIRPTWLRDRTRLAHREKVAQAMLCREKTIAAIVFRIRDLARRYGQPAETNGVTCTVVHFNTLFLLIAPAAKGTYFCVMDEANRNQMRGYYDLREGSPDWIAGDGEPIDVISWKRGVWETA